MSGEPRPRNQQVVPRPRSSAGRAGVFVSGPSPETGSEPGAHDDAEAARTARPRPTRRPSSSTTSTSAGSPRTSSRPTARGPPRTRSLEPFVIIQPPPNVTGSLHLGHAQRTTVEDLMVRHARMQGRPALFLPGLDHASIAAQFVLDGILAKEGESRATLGRERYLERMQGFIDETRTVILDAAAAGRRQLRLGPPPLHDGRGERRGPYARPSCGSTARASRTARRRSSTGAPAAGPASATSR